MSDKHFTLHIHPAELRPAATQVAELHEQMGTLRTQVGAAPGDIGNAWTGSAATSLKGEMAHLSTVLGTFRGKLDGVPAALRSLAKDYDEALEQLPGLNQKWDAAEQAYQDAVGAADTARNQSRQALADSDQPPNRAITQEIDDIHSGAISAAASTKQSTQHGLETTFGYLKQWLAQQTRALGSTLHDAGPVSVSDDEVAKWNAGQSPQVDVSSITSQLTLAKENLDEVERLRIAPEVEDAIDRLQDARPRDELRIAHARTVRRDDPEPARRGLLGHVRRLVMRADQPVEEQDRPPAGVAVLAHLQRPAGPHPDDHRRSALGRERFPGRRVDDGRGRRFWIAFYSTLPPSMRPCGLI